jgi:hypothetical protein
MVVTIANVSWSVCREYFYACLHTVVTVVALSKLISYQGIVQGAGSSFKKIHVCPLPTPPPPQNSCYAVVFLFPSKQNRHDTFSACRNCRRDRARVYISTTLPVTVVNCCQRVATKLFFMFPFGREHYSDDSYNTFATVMTIWKQRLKRFTTTDRY